MSNENNMPSDLSRGGGGPLIPRGGRGCMDDEVASSLKAFISQAILFPLKRVPCMEPFVNCNAS
jgi:hypothetical protein